MIALIVKQLAAWGLPEPLRKAAAWASVAVAIALFFGAIYAGIRRDAVNDHEAAKTADSIEAIDTAAAQRANDIVRNIAQEQARADAINGADRIEQAKPPEARATLPPQAKALACKQLEAAYSERELSRMDAYRENCA